MQLQYSQNWINGNDDILGERDKKHNAGKNSDFKRVVSNESFVTKQKRPYQTIQPFAILLRDIISYLRA
jgi:hypothetical protein